MVQLDLIPRCIYVATRCGIQHGLKFSSLCWAVTGMGLHIYDSLILALYLEKGKSQKYIWVTAEGMWECLARPEI